MWITFVVDSRGFRDGGWIDTAKGRPSSDALHVIERFRRADFGQMMLSVTMDDPQAYLAPWTMEKTLSLMPDAELIEAFCDGQDPHPATQPYRPCAAGAAQSALAGCATVIRRA